MKPMDRAARIVHIEPVDVRFAVSIGDEHFRVLIGIEPTEKEARQRAEVVKFYIAREIKRAKADACCEVAAEIDARVAAGDPPTSAQASVLARKVAQSYNEMEVTR